MRVSSTLILASFGILASSSAYADVIEIQQVGLSYSPNNVDASPGDTIRFTWTGGTHTVTTGINCDAGFSNGLFFDEPLTESNPIVEITIPNDFEGELNYLCDIGQHCAAGMDGVVNVLPSKKVVINIQQVGLSYVPNSVDANPGDTIRYTWTGGTHTVTSGINCDPSSVNGVFFDEPLTEANPIVEITIPDNFTGELEYLCDIGQHCAAGMDGVINVISPSIPGDFNNDGLVNGSDLGLLLSAFGSSDPVYDLNEDGSVNGGDIGLLLAAWSS